MPRGGRRPGAGRKLGGKNRRTSERKAAAERAVEAALAEGITPLEVMLEAMRYHYAAGELDAAAEIARHAAPYVHPRLQAIEQTGKGGAPVAVTVVGGIDLAVVTGQKVLPLSAPLCPPPT
jgi:hypothetical protein